MNTNLIGRLPLAAKVGLPLAATAAIAAACSSSGGGSSSNAAGSAGGSSAGGGGSASGVTITKHNGPSGAFLTDSKGRSLYLFASDSAKKSTCSGPCLSAWPALTSSGAVHAGSGVSASDISTLKASSATQIEYHGHPLYYYAGDNAAGQANGQGLDQFGAKWWLVTPAGAELTGQAAAGGSQASSGSSGGSGGGNSAWG